MTSAIDERNRERVGGDGQAPILTLKGAALASALKALPDDISSQVMALSYLPPNAATNTEPNAIWYADVCQDHLLTIYIGHEDPKSFTSVYDGKVVTSIPCGG